VTCSVPNNERRTQFNPSFFAQCVLVPIPMYWLTLFDDFSTVFREKCQKGKETS